MKEHFQQVLRIVPVVAAWETMVSEFRKWIVLILSELGDFGQSNEYPLVMNMPCLFLVPLNAIKERKEAPRRPQRHVGTHQSSRTLNNAVGV